MMCTIIILVKAVLFFVGEGICGHCKIPSRRTDSKRLPWENSDSKWFAGYRSIPSRRCH